MEDIFALSIALLAIGLAGIATERHLIVILFSIELIFVASVIALIGFFLTRTAYNPDIIIMLFAIFAVAAVEIITVVTLYVYMKHTGVDFDVRKLSRLKW